MSLGSLGYERGTPGLLSCCCLRRLRSETDFVNERSRRVPYCGLGLHIGHEARGEQALYLKRGLRDVSSPAPLTTGVLDRDSLETTLFDHDLVDAADRAGVAGSLVLQVHLFIDAVGEVAHEIV